MFKGRLGPLDSASGRRESEVFAHFGLICELAVCVSTTARALCSTARVGLHASDVRACTWGNMLEFCVRGMGEGEAARAKDLVSVYPEGG